MRILVLSHIPLLADAVAGALQERFGFQACPVYSPKEAEETARVFAFDIAVIDWDRRDTRKESAWADSTPNAVDIGKRIHFLLPRCKLIFYREQTPALEYLMSEQFCFDSVSITDRYETLYNLIRKTDVHLTH